MAIECSVKSIISPPNQGTRFNWKKFWSLAIPLKVKNFIWRTIQNCIPTLENLRRKHVEVYPICSVCNSDIETLDHILFSCAYARKCWDLSHLDHRDDIDTMFCQKLVDFFETRTPEDIQLLCCVA